MSETAKLFESLSEIIEHVVSVEKGVIDLSKEANLKISSFIEKSNIVATDDVLEALQYQDLISQQLSATIEAMNNVKTNIEYYVHSIKEDSSLMSENFKKLNTKLEKSIQIAKERQCAFEGKLSKNGDCVEEIEFF